MKKKFLCFVFILLPLFCLANPIEEPTVTRNFQLPKIHNVQIINDKHEILFTFSEKLPEKSLIVLKKQMSPWIQDIQDGWNSILILGNPDVQFQAKVDGEHIYLTVVSKKNLSKSSNNSLQTLSNLAKARLKLSQGDLKTSLDILHGLEKEKSYSPDLFILKSQTLHSAGYWMPALESLETAEAMYPKNEEIPPLKDEILFLHTPLLSIQQQMEYFKGTAVHHHSQLSAKVSLHKRKILFPNYLSFMIRRTDTHIRSIIKQNGVQEGFRGERLQGRLSLNHEYDNAKNQLSIFLHEIGIGLEGAFHKHDFWGSTKAELSWNRPHWDYLETLAGNGSEDHLLLQRFQRINQRLSTTLTIDGHLYHLEKVSKAAKTLGINLSTYYFLLLDNPTLNLGYVFNAEYIGKRVEKKRDNGESYYPLPLVDNENHTLNIESFYTFRQNFVFRGLVGYSIARFGNSASFLCSVRYRANESIHSLLEYAHYLSNTSSDSADRLTASFTWYY